MAVKLRPKLELFRFSLSPKDGEYKTFRNFALDELNAKKNNDDKKIMIKLFDYFKNGLVSMYAKDHGIKKQLKLIKTKANKYLKNQPQYDDKSYIIYGVISGGRFGRNGMMSDASEKIEDANAFGPNKTILRYYYFLLYLPLDHNEGFFIIHSNSKEETITDIFKIYISRLFQGKNYGKPSIIQYCPKSFQEEFKNNSIIKKIEFRNTYIVGDNFVIDPIRIESKEYDVKIEITPKKSKSKLVDKDKLIKQFGNLFFGKDKLEDFNSKKVTLNNLDTNSDRKFELDKENLEIIPVIYLEDKIKNYNKDDTPNYDELNNYCQDLFKNEILKEIRPDKKYE